MIEYLEKFRLDGKTAFVVGGAGLIGREVSIALASSGAKTIILEKEEKTSLELIKGLRDKGYNAHFRAFNCSEMKNIEKSFISLIDEFRTIEKNPKSKFKIDLPNQEILNIANNKSEKFNIRC